LSDQHADALQKTSGYRVAHSSRCCGYKWNAYGRITALLEDGIYSSAELSRSSALTLAAHSFLLVTQSRPARRALAAREMAL
jgi:hypothetical protein